MQNRNAKEKGNHSTAGGLLSKWRHWIAARALSLCLVAILAGCGNDVELRPFELRGIGKVEDPHLAHVVAEYFSQEALQNWDALYEMRRSEYKAVVPRDVFVGEMEKSWRGLHFASAEIDKILEDEGGKVVLWVVLREIAMGQDAALEQGIIEWKRPWLADDRLFRVRWQGPSFWILEGGQWYPSDPGHHGISTDVTLPP